MSDLWALDDLPSLFHLARWGFDYEGIVHRLRNDDQFALEMRLCNEWHMPHSVFLDWEPEDQANALAAFAYETRRCGRCGIHPMDWPDPMVPEFDAILEVCPGCAETDRYQRHITEQQERMPKSAGDGVRIALKRRGD
jgi:hypothetical protein